MIGVYDSGVGGLSVLAEIRLRMPRADLIYLADQCHAPYGEKTLEQVRAYALRSSRLLIDLGADTVVIACNTASAAALAQLRADTPAVPIVGMEPAVRPAAAATRTGVVAVLATPTTFQAEVLGSLVGRFAAGIEVIPHPCPGWASMVEAHGRRVDPAPIRAVVEPLIAAGADTFVLGCTHYAFLASAIAEAAGPEATVIDPSAAVAARTATLAPDTGRGSTTFLTTGDPQRFAAQVRELLGIAVHPRAVVI